MEIGWEFNLVLAFLCTFTGFLNLKAGRHKIKRLRYCFASQERLLNKFSSTEPGQNVKLKGKFYLQYVPRYMSTKIKTRLVCSHKKAVVSIVSTVFYARNLKVSARNKLRISLDK